MTVPAVKAQRSVPVHRLGISQILSFGFLFYAFAPLKPYVSEAASLRDAQILYLVSIAIIAQALAMPVFGYACDRFGALRVMTTGFITGSLGLFLLGFTGTDLTSALPSSLWAGMCFILMVLGLGMSSYETAFSAAIQLDEENARRKISIITLYGGVASTISWLSLTPLLSSIGFFATTSLVAFVLVLIAFVIWHMQRDKQHNSQSQQQDKPLVSFRWQLLKRVEKQSIIYLAVSGGLQYLMFSATSLLLISYFEWQFGIVAWAVILASICGPFQVVGRYIEMQYGHHLDARLTGLIANSLVPLALLIIQIPSPISAIIAMILFGMGVGVITVSYGFVTNLYFRAETYGRAKGISATARVLGTAIGPSIGGWLFTYYRADYMMIMVGLSLISTLSFSALLTLKPTNHLHRQK